MRANALFDAGPLNLRFITELHPTAGDKVILVSLTGKVLKDVMENGVSAWPKYDGRWAVCSGLKYSFDPQ